MLNTLAPLVMAEFQLNQTSFGWLISAISISYAASTLGAGWVLDKFGVNRGISAAVGWWSAAAVGTGLVGSLPGLIVCRAALGVGESAGVPAVGKLNGIYLKPEERALGAAVNGIGLSLGAAIAPLWVGVAQARGWRLPFILTGLMGFVWIPIWLLISKKIPARFANSEDLGGSPSASIQRDWQTTCAASATTIQNPGDTTFASPRAHSPFVLLLNRNLILLVVANVFWMGGYSLWTNWTTLYLIHVHHLTLRETAGYVWIPPLISNLGGFFGGWLSYRWMRRNLDPVDSRRKAVWISAAGSVVTLFIPFAGSAALATALISASYFFALSGSVNIYALPIDLFGPKKAGLAIAALTCAYGLLQTAISPAIGYLSDHKLYTQVLWLVTLPLFLGALTLNAIRTSAEPGLES